MKHDEPEFANFCTDLIRQRLHKFANSGTVSLQICSENDSECWVHMFKLLLRLWKWENCMVSVVCHTVVGSALGVCFKERRLKEKGEIRRQRQYSTIICIV